MEKQCIFAPGAPPALGPYSHAVKAGGFVYCSGQGPIHPDGSGVLRGTIEDETRRVLDNLKAVLEAAGSSLDKVVKSNVYLADMNQFQAMNAVYAEYFPANPPARTTIQAARLPMDFQVEIDVIATA